MEAIRSYVIKFCSQNLDIIKMSIKVKLCNAILTRDTQIFSNMDPFCILTLGRQEYTSNVIKDGGKKPIWNQTFHFSNSSNTLILKVMDEDMFTNDLVGQGAINIQKFRKDPSEQKEIVEVKYKGEKAGRVQLLISGPQAVNQTPMGTGVINNPSIVTHNQLRPHNAEQIQRVQSNRGVQVLQNVNMANHLQPPQQNTLRRPNSLNRPAEDVLSNNGWGDFDPSKVKGNGLSRGMSMGGDNPFHKLGEALMQQKGGLNGIIPGYYNNQTNQLNQMNNVSYAHYAQRYPQPTMAYIPVVAPTYYYH